MRCFVVSSVEIQGNRLDCLFNLSKRSNVFRSRYRSEPLFKLVKSYSGGTPRKDNEGFWGGDIPWASPKDFTAFQLHDTEDHITEEGLKSSSAKLVPSGSVLVVVRSGILNHSFPVAITQAATAINQDVRALIPNPRANLLPEYLATYFAVFGKRLLPLITKHSTTVQSINTDQFSKLAIPLPPLSVQEQIIKIMEAAYARKQQHQEEANRLLDSLDGYILDELDVTKPDLKKRSTFCVPSTRINSERMDVEYYQPFYESCRKALAGSKYPCRPLREITEFVTNGRTPSKETYTDDSLNGTPIIKVSTASGRTVNLAKLRYAKPPFKGNQTSQAGDIFILAAAHQAEYVGKNVSILTDEPTRNTYFVGELIGIRSNPKLCESYYLFAFLASRIAFVLINREKRGQTSHLYPDDFEKLPVPTPSRQVQHRIATEVKRRMAESDRLRATATKTFDESKQEIEAMLLGR